jgi:hypothetical protein
VYEIRNRDHKCLIEITALERINLKKKKMDEVALQCIEGDEMPNIGLKLQ